MRLCKHLQSGPACPKVEAVQRWVSRRLRRTAHERRVAGIGCGVFDVTRRLHCLSLADRRLLRLGALVHDVGRCVSNAEHPAEGAWMILADTSLPISDAERRALAYLTLYHRDAVPPVGHDAILHREDDADRFAHVLALLRVADALDSRSLEEPAEIAFSLTPAAERGASGAVLRAGCCVRCECPDARRVYRRRKKFDLLEQLLGVRVEVELHEAGARRLVA